MLIYVDSFSLLCKIKLKFYCYCLFPFVCWGILEFSFHPASPVSHSASVDFHHYISCRVNASTPLGRMAVSTDVECHGALNQVY